MATIDIGKIAFTQKGTWSSATAYTAKDVVQYTDNGETSSYVAVASSTNQAPATNGTINTTYWNIFAKGSSIGSTNQGTWDSATAYNKNDVIQYTQDGTHTFVAVQGSTNQAPQTLGVVNTTYWTKLASGVGSSGNTDIIASVTASSSSSLVIDGYFDDAVYSHYKIVYQNIKFSADCYVNQRAWTASGELSSDLYSGVTHSWQNEYDNVGYYWNSRRNQPIEAYQQNDNVIQIGRDNRSSQSNYRYLVDSGNDTFNGYVELYSPQLTAPYHYGTFYGFMTGGSQGSKRGVISKISFNVLTGNALTGWQLAPHTGNISSGKMILYGIKR